MCTWNDISGCYLNKKHKEMPFRTLTNMLLVIFTVSDDFTHFKKILKCLTI